MNRITVTIASMSIVAVIGLIACGPLGTEPMPDIPETVEYDTVKIDYAGEDGIQETQSNTLEQALVGDSSELARLTRETVFGTNRTIHRVFRLIEVIQRFPTSRRTDELWEWEGQPNGDYLLFRITNVDEDTHAYTMRWGNSAQDNREVFSGEFTPIEPDTEPQQGSGTLRLDFDAVHAYDDSSAEGEMIIAFRVRNQVRQVRVGFYQFSKEGNPPLDAIYEYVELPSGRGELVFFGHGDWSQDGRPFEFFSADAVWLADRQGRIAARIENGSLAQPYTVDQCWDAAEKIVWADAQPDIANYDDGSKDACAEPLQPLQIDAPTYQDHNGQPPEVPTPHPEE